LAPRWPTHYSRSVDGIHENITYLYRDDNLESATGTSFHADCIYERLWVVDKVLSKAPKTLRDRHVKGLSLIRCRVVLDLDRAVGLRQRCVASSLLILLGLDFSQALGTEDLATYQSLQSVRPSLCLAIYNGSEASWVGTIDVLIRIWDN
jgi:hypothetical protein